MFVSPQKILAVLALTATLVLSACSSVAQSPTPSPGQILTQAVMTVQAQQTLDAPKVTPTATFTTVPSATPTIEVPTAAVVTATPQPTVQVGLPTATVAVSSGSGSGAADKAEWVSNDPPDEAKVYTSAKFDITWTIKNTGKTTWKTTYKYRLSSGTLPMEHKEFAFKAEVKPGETGTFVVDAVAPSSAGKYNTWWKLTNDQGQNFGDMTLIIVVVKGDATAAPSATPTETPTETPES